LFVSRTTVTVNRPRKSTDLAPNMLLNDISNIIGQVAYLYTGKELDAETGLYNFHARLYDPDIGRFFQPDPREQYASPYKYAGNSPISLVDPDGEFAFTLLSIIFAVVGAYLAGAAYSNTWNPIEWNWKDPKLFGNILLGGLAGYAAPAALVQAAGAYGAIATTGLVTGGMYISGAVANNNWDLTKWDWSSPKTVEALFKGTTSLFSLAEGIEGFSSAVTSLEFTDAVPAAIAAGIVTYVHGVVANNGTAQFWKWNFTNPATLNSLLGGLERGLSIPVKIKDFDEKFVKPPNSVEKLAKSKITPDMKAAAFKKGKTLKDAEKVTGNVIMSYMETTSANAEWDIKQWDGSSFSTYNTVLKRLYDTNDWKGSLELIEGHAKSIQAALGDQKSATELTTKIVEAISKIAEMNTASKTQVIQADTPFLKRLEAQETESRKKRNEGLVVERAKWQDELNLPERQKEEVFTDKRVSQDVSQRGRQMLTCRPPLFFQRRGGVWHPYPDEDIERVCAESTTEPADPVPDRADPAAGTCS
jgi:RHS repeat-associated protein